VAIRDFFNLVTGLASLTKELRRCADALERIADKQEGVRRGQPQDPGFELIHTSDAEYERFFQLRKRFARDDLDVEPESPPE
jgi:hypothetical protein